MKGRDRVDTLIAMSLGVSKYAHGFFEIPSGKIEMTARPNSRRAL